MSKEDTSRQHDLLLSGTSGVSWTTSGLLTGLSGRLRTPLPIIVRLSGCSSESAKSAGATIVLFRNCSISAAKTSKSGGSLWVE